MQNNILKPGIVLLIITTIAAICLGFVNNITLKPIAAQIEKTTNEAMSKILPSASTFKSAEDYTPTDSSNVKAYSIGYEKGEDTPIVGYAVSVVSKGYGGELSIMVGISNEGVIQGVTLISHSETPGLGANADSEWINQYKDKSGELSVTKSASSSESEIQAITSATITSKAITDAVNEVTDFYNQTLSKGGESK